MGDELTLRPAGDGDVEALAITLGEGFGSFRSFAPSGWAPPAVTAQDMRRELARPGVWCLLAEDATGEPVGHVSFMPAIESRAPDPDPRLAHLWQLFVRRTHWGRGVATRLHGRAVEEASARGFAHMRLFTPAGQARARRFYEREGWRMTARLGVAPELGLPIVEYRRELPPR